MHYNIPTEIHDAGKQYNRVDLARRIAAARQARKEEDRAIGHQLSWESIMAPLPKSEPEEAAPDEQAQSCKKQGIIFNTKILQHRFFVF